MIAYFKYTQGGTFKLNGIPYIGYFNISDGNAYTGKIKDQNSEELTPNSTFLADFYLNKMEFDNQYESILKIIPSYSNVFDILNKNDLDKLMHTVDMNNLAVFKSLTLTNPQIIDFDENDSHYYGLSASPIDIRADDSFNGKDVISHLEPFTRFPEWEFLDKIQYGTLLVLSNQTFKYLCSTEDAIISIKGSFTDHDNFEYDIIRNLMIPEQNIFEEVYQIYYDEFENRIVIIINDEIMIYDAINYIECDNLILIDSIKLTDVNTKILRWNLREKFSNVRGKFNKKYYNINPNSTDFMRFGKNYRITLDDNIVSIWNKYSSELLKKVKLSNYNISNVVNIAIRNVDDYVAILHEKNGYKLTFFDAFDVEGTIKTENIYNLKDSSNFKLLFAGHDSNILYLSSKDELQVRFVSNPAYPISRIREENLKYPYNASFSNLFQKFGNCVLKWNTKKLNSNYYTNIIFDSVTKSNKNYFLLHNSGRIYPLKQDISDFYLNSIDLNLEKSYKGIICSDHSFGLFFNKTISAILKDVLNLYTKANNAFLINEKDVFLKNIEEITYETNNLYMNGNENVNVITIQRILNLLVELQKKLLANLES